MKFFVIVLVLIGPIRSLFQTSEKHPDSGSKCKTILDSAKILAQTGEFSINWEPVVIERERHLQISQWFQNRPFSELECLLESDNKMYRFYGYILVAAFHEDSLRNKYSNLLTDTTAVQFSTKIGLLDSKMTLGTLLKIATEKLVEDNRNWKKRPEIENRILSFIGEYAQYPKTYKSISFPDFAMSSGKEGLSGFNVTHKYEIKNNKGAIVKVTSAFVFDAELNINVIQEDSSSYMYSSRPLLQDWFQNYGRRLNYKDSLTLKLR